VDAIVDLTDDVHIEPALTFEFPPISADMEHITDARFVEHRGVPATQLLSVTGGVSHGQRNAVPRLEVPTDFTGGIKEGPLASVKDARDNHSQRDNKKLPSVKFLASRPTRGVDGEVFHNGGGYCTSTEHSTELKYLN